MQTSSKQLALPEGQELAAALLRCSVPHEDINEVLRLRPDPVRTPEQWNLLETHVGLLRKALGGHDLPAPLPRVAENPYLPLYILIATLDDICAYHHSRRIPDDVSWLTLTDLGRNVAVHRRLTGSAGFDDYGWLSRHFTGTVYALGRLQFERIRLHDETARLIAAAGGPAEPGATALSVHIPDYSGPLSVQACEDSLQRARAFLARHFPEEDHQVAICRSWMLDTQLPDHLPADSNIVAFQRRFQIVAQSGPKNSAALRFVFGVPGEDVDWSALPRRTSLEKAIVGHLEAGGHWREGVGWLRL